MSGQLIIFRLENETLVFESETNAFDEHFDALRAYQVPKSITSIEWLDERNLMISNDKSIKLYKI